MYSIVFPRLPDNYVFGVNNNGAISGGNLLSRVIRIKNRKFMCSEYEIASRKNRSYIYMKGPVFQNTQCGQKWASILSLSLIGQTCPDIQVKTILQMNLDKYKGNYASIWLETPTNLIVPTLDTTFVPQDVAKLIDFSISLPPDLVDAGNLLGGNVVSYLLEYNGEFNHKETIEMKDVDGSVNGHGLIYNHHICLKYKNTGKPVFDLPVPVESKFSIINDTNTLIEIQS